MYIWRFICKTKVTRMPISEFFFLIIYRKYFLFQFYSRGMGMHISILTGFKMDA